MKRALLLRLGALGDVVLATPVAQALRAAGYEVDWVTDARLAPLLAGHQALRKVWPLARPSGLWGAWRLGWVLRGERYDVALDLHNKVRTRLVLAACGAARRLVLRKRRGLDLLRAALGRLAPLTRAHAVDLYLEMLEPMGIDPAGRALGLPVPAEDFLGSETRPVVALAPGAAHATKRWPADRFAAVGDALAERGAAVLLVGGPSDRSVLAEVRRLMKSPPRADTATLDAPALGAVLRRCALLVSNDTGPVHLAAAHGTPVVAIYGPTSPVRWGPVGERHRTVALGLPCSPCSNHGGARCPIGTHACMEDLPAERVIAVALEVFGERSSPASAARSREQLAPSAVEGASASGRRRPGPETGAGE